MSTLLRFYFVYKSNISKSLASIEFLLSLIYLSTVKILDSYVDFKVIVFYKLLISVFLRSIDERI